MKSTVRAFIAVEISSNVRAAARKALKPLRAAFPNVKWIDDDNMHVTLKFLGANVPTTELHKVVAAIERACKDVEQFDLVFEEFGAFPDVANPRTLWIGVSDGVFELRKLARRIDEEMEKIGFPREGREFSPHLTIGRIREKDRAAIKEGAERNEDGGDARQAAQFAFEKDERERRRARKNDRRAKDERLEFDHSLAALPRMLTERANVFFGVSPVDSVFLFSSELDRNGAKYESLAEIELAPLGSSVEEESRFDPKEYDDGDCEVDQDALEERLGAQIDADFDLDALDVQIEAELRAACGAEFVERSKRAKGVDPKYEPRRPRRNFETPRRDANKSDARRDDARKESSRAPQTASTPFKRPPKPKRSSAPRDVRDLDSVALDDLAKLLENEED